MKNYDHKKIPSSAKATDGQGKKMREYNHARIEHKWQKEWEKQGIYKAQNKSKKRKFYSLIEFPYPSGAGLHVGHIRSNTAMDIISRKRRMEGYNVLYPIGWDAFGLPTENYAIKTGIPPAKVTKQNTDTFRRQLKALGFSFDWSREINTTDPTYYKWTQWIFLQMYKKGLAYKKKTTINWCPACKIGLANEEVVDGKCERCGKETVKKEKEQWMLAITKYADRLDKDLDLVDYPDRIKAQQRNWIGRSEGSEIEFKIHLPPAPSEGRGEETYPEPLPKEVGFGYQTTDPKTWKILQDSAIEMRKNPTEAEEILWQSLRKNLTGYHFRRQQIINRFIVDFVCLSKKIIIEVDGDIHDLQKEKDAERSEILKVLGFRIIRFKNEEVIKNINSVIKKIEDELKVLPFGEDLGGVKVFTTRADTLFGATYVVLAPEHELINNLKLRITNWEEVEVYIKKIKNKTEIERTDEKKEKTGIELKGVKAINPANSEEIPVWIADYVLASYGTGAIMAVPRHDERDRKFAEKYNLPIIDRPLFDAVEITKKVGGKIVTKYKLRDWIFSRQRYWGEPIPLIHCPSCAKASQGKENAGWIPVPEKDLPVVLPKVKSYKPTDTGESPLSLITKWVNTKCPKCKGPAKRETDTMPNWAGSSWYYLRYTDPKDKKEFANKNILKYWTPVDWYNGGMEHVTLHLLYSRFWHKFLYDLKLVPGKEPYQKRTAHGMILASDGEKMSKSRGNVVNPDKIIDTYGADTLRLYEMFIGPFGDTVAWNDESMIGPRRFIEKVWRIAERLQINTDKKLIKTDKNHQGQSVINQGSSVEVSLRKLLHKTIKKVGEDIEGMRFNTAISAMMILATEVDKAGNLSAEDFKKFLQILAPFAPHVTEELWQILINADKKLIKTDKKNQRKSEINQRTSVGSSIHLAPWPKYDAGLIKDDEIKIGVQVNGKIRAEILIQVDESEDQIKELAQKDINVLKFIEGKKIKKVIYVKNRLVNIVI